MKFKHKRKNSNKKFAWPAGKMCVCESWFAARVGKLTAAQESSQRKALQRRVAKYFFGWALASRQHNRCECNSHNRAPHCRIVELRLDKSDELPCSRHLVYGKRPISAVFMAIDITAVLADIIFSHGPDTVSYRARPAQPSPTREPSYTQASCPNRSRTLPRPLAPATGPGGIVLRYA